MNGMSCTETISKLPCSSCWKMRLLMRLCERGT